jgi:hypothetical protein
MEQGNVLHQSSRRIDISHRRCTQLTPQAARMRRYYAYGTNGNGKNVQLLFSPDLSKVWW